MIPKLHLIALLASTLATSVFAADWPQWLGANRDGTLRDKGWLKKFPTNGLQTVWRVPIHPGYSGPAVAGERLYVMDRLETKRLERKPGDKSIPAIEGKERVLCLDARTGATNWEHSYESAYRIDYPGGPRTTPLVHQGNVLTLGAMGDLRCLDAHSGANREHAALALVVRDEVPVCVRTIAELPDRVVIGDREAVEPPLVAKHIAQEPPIRMRRNAVDFVVRRHDADGTRFPNRRLEGSEEDLTQLTHRHVRRCAVLS